MNEAEALRILEETVTRETDAEPNPDRTLEAAATVLRALGADRRFPAAYRAAFRNAARETGGT